MSSRRQIRARFSGTGYTISKSTIDFVKKEVEKYLEELISSIVLEHKRQNEIRRQVGLPIRKTIRYENLIYPTYGPLGGEVGGTNRKTTLSAKGGIVE